MENFCGSEFWNQSILWTSKDPQLTPCFRNTVLIWFPCLVLWSFSITDIMWRKKSRYSDIPWSFLNVSRFVIVFILICLIFTHFGLMVSVGSEVTLYPVHYVSTGILLMSFIFVCYLQYLHKIKGHRTSGLLFCFWFILTCCAIPQLMHEASRFGSVDFRSFNWDSWQFIGYVTYFTLITIMFILNCFIDKPPRNRTYPKYANPSPELEASFLNKIHFQWFTRMSWLGFKRPLTEKDLHDINPHDTCAELYPPFEKHFKRSVEKNKGKPIKDGDPTIVTNGSTLYALIRAYGGPFWFSAILRVLADLLLVITPLILGVLINFVSEEAGALWKGLFLTFALFLATFLQAYLNGQYYHNNFNVGYRIRAGLQTAIYRKALKISSASKRNTTVGEIVNLMAVDANRFFELMPNLHILWSGLMIIGLVTFILFRYLSYAVFAGLAVAIITIPFSIWTAMKLKILQIDQMVYKDERVKSMNEILSGMKVLKLYAWEPSFEEVVLGVRKTEMKIMRNIALYNAFAYFIWSLAPFLIAMASFITYVLIGGTLTPTTAFVSLALFNTMRFPMSFFPLIINFLMQALVAAKRIDHFLNSAELDPNNVTNNPSENAMHVKNGNFSWGGPEKILRNINMDIKKGSLSAVVGPVGVGKSSLISAFLGEMEKQNGEVNVDGRLAYVPQQAWIQNATLQDNILFGLPYNKAFYKKVLHACALESDLSILPGGDQTEIGEKGINLSGGQKQRVSLARAVYSGADIYIFDDPLSAVDTHVGKHIFEHVMSETGMLKGKTRLLVTHALSYLPKVDEIFVMLDGQISERGTYKELLARKGAFAEFLIQYFQAQGEELEVHDEETKKLLQRTESYRASKISKTKRRSSAISIEKNKKPPMTKLIQIEEAGTGSIGMGVYVKYFNKFGLWLTIFAFGSNFFFQIASILSNVWLALWAQSVRIAGDYTWNFIYSGVFGGFGVLQAFFLIIAAVSFAIGCLRVARSYHNDLLHNIMRVPMWFMDVTPLGRILNRFSRDLDVIDNVIPIFIRNYVFMFFSVVAVLVVISIVTPWFLTTVVPIIVIYYIVQKLYIETSRQVRRMESLTRSPIFAHFAETISGQSTIRAYSAQTRFIADSETKIDFNQSIAYHALAANRWLQLRLEVVGAFVVLFAALFAIIGDQAVGPAVLGLSISYALQISQLLSFLVRVAAEIETNIVAIERIQEYIDKPQEAAWKTVEVDEQWPQRGIVQFKNFQVRYREGLELVLRGISFETKEQEKIGIVGRTGAGKSSLTLSLFRLIEAAGGKIIIDGIEIADIGLHSLRSRLTIIPQDPVLFSGSLRMNIDPFNSYSDDAIWIALEHSHLKTFAQSLSDGLSHKISEGGENLSVGQRQLVCLARALLRKTKVLILDEATAAVDFETDELIQKTIRMHFNDCTILTIAHRLNTIMDSDRIIVLDQGMIVEFDSPQALLMNKNSIFYSMARNAGLVDEGS